MSDREYWATEQARLARGYDSVRERLIRIPGVVEVGIGLRERRGQLEEEAVYIVAVTEKRPVEELAPDEVIPASIDGVPIDVQEYREPRLLLGFGDEDWWKNHATKVGGIRIGAEDASGTGTLGCFCTDNGSGSVALLSNHHVLFSGSAKVGSGVGQPEHSAPCCCTCNEIGKVLRGDEPLDCAIASLNGDVPHFPKVRRIKRGDGSVEEEGLIAGVDDPVMNQVVWKVGARTGLTRGTISQVTPSVRATMNAPFTKFADHGDSGSVVVEDATGNVVGLLFAIPKGTPSIGIMKKITDVQTTLNITVLVSDPSATYTEAADGDDDDLFPLPPASPFAAIVERIRAHPQASAMVRSIEPHVAEGLALVNRKRAFTVAWHRNRGPAWLAAFGRSAREPIYRVPDAIDGVGRIDALRAMLAALRTEGSAALREDIDRYEQVIVATLGRAHNVDELLDLLAAAEPVAERAAEPVADELVGQP